MEEETHQHNRSRRHCPDHCHRGGTETVHVTARPLIKLLIKAVSSSFQVSAALSKRKIHLPKGLTARAGLILYINLTEIQKEGGLCLGILTKKNSALVKIGYSKISDKFSRIDFFKLGFPLLMKYAYVKDLQTLPEVEEILARL